MSAKLKAERPLSPHLQIYNWQITNTLSILNRITGFGLVFGTLLLSAWIWAAAYSPECFATLGEWAHSWIGMLFLFGWTAAFFYHLLAGVRHMMWDMGKGIDMPSVNATGIALIIATTAMTAGVWLYIFLA